MQRFFTFLVASILTLCAGGGLAQNLDANGALPRATPESVGVDSQILTNVISQLDEKFNRVDSVMILRNGKVVAEAWRAPFTPEASHPLYSLSKSVCSTAVGFAVVEGKLSLEQKIVEILPEELPEEYDPRLKDVTLQHLLTMSCGHNADPWPAEMMGTDYGLEPFVADVKPSWATQFFSRPIAYEPGEQFFYNTTGTYMCSAAVQKATGEKIVDYLTPRLFEPLKIEKPYWEESPQGVNKGGTGLFLKTEDVAKFGQLLLQKGRWNDEQLIPEWWIDDATAKHVSTPADPSGDWGQGYGYQFWRCRYNAFRCAGMHSQFCVVMPDQKIVVAINSDCSNYQGILNVLFDNLLNVVNEEPLPENPTALARLREVEKSLMPKEGESGSEVLELAINSAALRRVVNYRVYLPNGYRTTSFSFPTLYLLHGLGGNETNWSDPNQGNMQQICDQYFAANPAEKRIVVMPDGGDLWYRDTKDDSNKYETFFFSELIPEIERRFRCKTSASTRAIAGLSMGGYGALLYATRRPELFDSCYAMSAAIRTKDEIEKQSFEEFLRRYRSVANQSEEETNRFDDYFYANDPHTLVTKLHDDVKKSIRFLLDCGDDDYLLDGNLVFLREARDNNVNCELRIRDGAHNWQYWREALPLALQFISQ